MTAKSGPRLLEMWPNNNFILTSENIITRVENMSEVAGGQLEWKTQQQSTVYSAHADIILHTKLILNRLLILDPFQLNVFLFL